MFGNMILLCIFAYRKTSGIELQNSVLSLSKNIINPEQVPLLVWGFLFLYTLPNGFQLLPLKDSETSQTKKSRIIKY